MEVICQDRAGRDTRLGEGCADGWKAGAAGCQAPLGFPSIWHRNVPSRGSAILPQLGRDSGDPQNAGGRELRGGAGWVKAHCWAFPQKAVVPKPAGPSLGHTVNSLPRKRPVVRPEGASGGESLCQPTSDLGHQLRGQLPYRTAPPPPARDAFPGRSGKLQAARGMRDSARGVEGGTRGVGARALASPTHTGLEASCPHPQAGSRWGRRAVTGAPSGRPAHKVTYLVEASPGPTCPSWELS